MPSPNGLLRLGVGALLSAMILPAASSLAELLPSEWTVTGVASNPITGEGVEGSAILAVDEDLNHVFGLGFDPARGVQIDGTTDTILAEFHLANRADFAMASPTSLRLYVSHPATGRVSVVDELTREVVEVHEFPGVCCFFRQGGLAVDPQLNRVYVALAGVDAVAVIDEGAGEVRTIPLRATFLAVDAETHRLFLHSQTGEITVVDTRTELVERVLRFPMPVAASDMAVNSATGRVYLTALLEQQDNLWVVNGETGDAVALTLDTQPLVVIPDRLRDQVYVVAHDPPTMWVLDATTDQVRATVHLQVPGAPAPRIERHYAAANIPAGKVYIHCDGNIAVVQRAPAIVP